MADRPTLAVLDGGGRPEQDRDWVNQDPGPEATAVRNRREQRKRDERARQLERRWHAIYLLYDADDRLLYVGISANGPGRLPAHARDKAWFRQVVRAEFVHVMGRKAAEAAELDIIRARDPVWNRAGKPSG